MDPSVVASLGVPFPAPPSGECTGGECKGSTESDGGGDPGFAITRGSGISQPSLNGTSRIKGNSNTQSGVR